jgi:uncharacterized protein (TIGR03067 family)
VIHKKETTMKPLTSLCGVNVVLTVVCMVAGQHKPEDKKDLDKMQGSWRVVSSQVGDEKASEDEVKDRKVTVKGNTMIYETGSERKEKREGTVKLDPKTKAFDWTFPKLGATMLAIYELKGDDLKIGFGNDGLIRPTRFEFGKEQVQWLLVLKREKPWEALAATDAIDRAPGSLLAGELR